VKTPQRLPGNTSRPSPWACVSYKSPSVDGPGHG
jgi:hypothetical protein